MRSFDNEQVMKVTNFVKILKEEDGKHNKTHYSREFDLGHLEDDLIYYVEQKRKELNQENLSPFKSRRKNPKIRESTRKSQSKQENNEDNISFPSFGLIVGAVPD